MNSPMGPLLLALLHAGFAAFFLLMLGSFLTLLYSPAVPQEVRAEKREHLRKIDLVLNGWGALSSLLALARHSQEAVSGSSPLTPYSTVASLVLIGLLLRMTFLQVRTRKLEAKRAEKLQAHRLTTQAQLEGFVAEAVAERPTPHPRD